MIDNWLRAVMGCQAVHLGERLSGATTATIQTALALFADGHVEPVVVKIYDRQIDGVGGRDVERDAAAMVACAEVGVAAPLLIDADPDGRRLGWPALVMTRLDGETRATGDADPHGWVDGLADELIAIASAPLPTNPLGGFHHWFERPIVAPAWADDAAAWASIDELLSRPLPSGPVRLIHRDFHPLNVLWHDGRVTGTVDWVNGCLGPIESDIASCRINIALADDTADGFALADRFLERCLTAGLPWDPVWDLDFVAGVADSTSAFLVGADLGATITLDGIQRTLNETVRRAFAAQ